MTDYQFRTATTIDYQKLNALLLADSAHPHIHQVDMPYRLTSRWQEVGCRMGIWEQNDDLVGWMLFQPPWWNLDYAIMPHLRGSDLEEEMFKWGQKEMLSYAERNEDEFWGSIEIFDNDPHLEATQKILDKLGFKNFDWSMNRLILNLDQTLPEPALPDGFKLRPFNPKTDTQAYVDLQRAAFESENMTVPWRTRMTNHPQYIPELDLIVENSANEPVGFCVCWLNGEVGQVEPLGVHPSTQGKGLGRALERAAYRQMQKFGAKKLLIDHASFNDKAINLSIQTGFRHAQNAIRYYVEVIPA